MSTYGTNRSQGTGGGGGGGGANQHLSNLIADTAINVDLLPRSNASINLGSIALAWNNGYFANAVFSPAYFNTAGSLGVFFHGAAFAPDGDLSLAFGESGNRINGVHTAGLILYGATSGAITLAAADATTDYTVKWPNAQGGANTFPMNDGSGNLSWETVSGSGTVTSVSVVSANGLAGTVATATTTPAITLSTTITGILQGNGTAISAATVGALTAAGTDGIAVTSGTGAVLGSGTSIAQHVADATHNGYLSSADWSTFNGKQGALTIGNLTDAGTDGITVTGGTGAVIGSGTSIAQHVADATHNGYLSSTDWSTFNGKGAGTVTAVSVASTNGFTGTSSGGATPALTLATSVTGVIKGNGTALSAATAGTDYSAGTSALATGILKSTTATGALSIATAADVPSPLTTKGDILSYSTLPVRHAVPGDYGDILADSAQTDGWRSATYLTRQISPNKNYIQYGDFENNATTGWSLGTTGTLVNGLPTGTPAFGSGTTNQTIAIVSSGQLAGAFSLSWASSVATTPGFMIATQAYTIDIEDQAKVLGFRFAYKVASGTVALPGTSANNYAVAVYDVTNSAWLPTVGAFNLVQTTGVGIATGTVQTGATTASIRLVVYVPTASSGAATMYFDDFSVGPQVSPQAPAMGDMVAETGWTFSAGFGTVTSQAVFTKRVGDQLLVRAFCVAGTTAASVASLTPPAKYTIDQTKGVVSPSQSALVGNWWAPTPSGTPAAMASNNNTGPAFTDGTNNAVFFAYQGQSAQFVKNNANNVLSANNAGFMTEFTIPISGWSSNSVASSDTDTRVVAAKYNTSTITIGTGDAIVNCTTQEVDTAGAYSAGVFTCPVSGIYRVSGSITWASTSASAANNNIYLTVNKNGSNFSRIGFYTFAVSSVSISSTIVGSTLVKCSAGDTLSVITSRDAAVSSTTLAGGSVANWVAFERLSGPAVITATESVNASYQTSSTTVATATETTIVCATKLFDSHNAYSSGVYTIPVSGKYQVNASIGMTGTSASSTKVTSAISKNGTDVSTANNWGPGSANAALYGQISDIISCLAGDQIAFKVTQNGGSTLTALSDTSSRFSITRVGN